MLSVAHKAGKIFACIVACLVAFDIVGVVACFFFDVMPLRTSSTALSYTIAAVLAAEVFEHTALLPEPKKKAGTAARQSKRIR